MHHCIPIAVIFIILSWTLTGCSLSLPPPSPQTLLSVFAEPFTCGFYAYDGTVQLCRAALVRDYTADTLTVYGEYSNTVLYSDGTAVSLLTGGSRDIPPLSVPLPDGYENGMAAFLSLFSVLPDDGFSAVYSDGGILVTNADGSYSAVFSEDRVPIRITLDGLSVTLDSFSVSAAPDP